MNEELRQKVDKMKSKNSFKDKYGFGANLVKKGKYTCSACGQPVKQEKAEELNQKADLLFQKFQDSKRKKKQKKKERQVKKVERKNKLKKHIESKVEKGKEKVLQQHFLMDSRVPVKGTDEEKKTIRETNKRRSQQYAQAAITRINAHKAPKKFLKKKEKQAQENGTKTITNQESFNDLLKLQSLKRRDRQERKKSAVTMREARTEAEKEKQKSRRRDSTSGKKPQSKKQNRPSSSSKKQPSLSFSVGSLA